MPQRHRYATRDELAAIIAQRTALTEPIVGAVLEALAEDGVPIDQLVKITAQEDAPDGPA